MASFFFWPFTGHLLAVTLRHYYRTPIFSTKNLLNPSCFSAPLSSTRCQRRLVVRKQLKSRETHKLDALFDKWKAEMKLNRKLNFKFLAGHFDCLALCNNSLRRCYLIAPIDSYLLLLWWLALALWHLSHAVRRSIIQWISKAFWILIDLLNVRKANLRDR